MQLALGDMKDAYDLKEQALYKELQSSKADNKQKQEQSAKVIENLKKSEFKTKKISKALVADLEAKLTKK